MHVIVDSLPLVVDRLMMDWAEKRVLILGAARQGTALARWLAGRGAHVTLSDMQSADELMEAHRELEGMEIRWALGGHPLQLLDGCDVLCLSGGVPTGLPIVLEAGRRGIPLSNDTQIFMEQVPCPTVGITGSAGKTTTTSLVGLMAEYSLPEQPLARAGQDLAPSQAIRHRTPFSAVYVGGNIGDPLINHLAAMQPTDLAVLEISSFQLEQMTASPSVAAVLNITPNHLDRHGTMQAYTAAKSRILQFQSEQDTAILSRDDPGAWGLRERVSSRLLTFSLEPLEPDLDGAYMDEGMLNLRIGSAYVPLLPRQQLRLRGDHNVSNVLAAFTIGHAIGLPLDAMLRAAAEFEGVPHRLELVREFRGARWYNDSIATTPERVMAAVRSFDEPLVLLLGGRDKQLPWEDLAALVRQRVDHVVAFGEAAGKVLDAIGAIAAGSTRTKSARQCATLEEAVAAAGGLAQPGDVVLLSPGGTSYDAFHDFEERGERFRKCVHNLS